VLGLSAELRERPSRLLGIEDGYTAFCFDEACVYIARKMREKGAPELPRRWDMDSGGEKSGEKDDEDDLVGFLKGFCTKVQRQSGKE